MGDLIFTFVGTIVLIVLFFINAREGGMTLKESIVKKCKGIMRIAKTKAPVLCEMHAKDLLVEKGRGKLAVLSNQANCELCSNKAKLI